MKNAQMMKLMSEEGLITVLGITIFIQAALTSFHHLYRGILYESRPQFGMLIAAGGLFVITLGFLLWYRRTRSSVSLVASVFVSLVWIGTGLFHSLYGHIIKDILFFAGVPLDAALKVHPALGADFIYPPNNFWFEATGAVELITSSLIVILTYRLVRNKLNRNERRQASFPVASMVAGTVAIGAVIVSGSLLMAYTATSDRRDLIHSFATIGLGALLLVGALTWFYKANTSKAA